jgi:VWFA-related protein
VADRNKEDFLLKEDGKPQEIEYFARQLDLAPTLGLLVDSSMSQRQVLQEERKASLEFFQQVLRPENDLAFVIGFDFEAKLMEGLTDDLGRLDKSLREIAVPRNSPGKRAGQSLPDCRLTDSWVSSQSHGLLAFIKLNPPIRCHPASSTSTHEFVAHAVDGNYELGVARIRLQFLSQPCNVYVHRACQGGRIIPPNLFEQLLAG